MWSFRGQQRPDFAIEPGPGQESVWDYPRPPALVATDRQVIVRTGDAVIADTRRAMRVLETASPPTYYLQQQLSRVQRRAWRVILLRACNNKITP